VAPIGAARLAAAWLRTAGLGAAPLGAVGLAAAWLRTAGLDAAWLGAAWLRTAGLGAAWLGAGLDAAWFGFAGLSGAGTMHRAHTFCWPGLPAGLSRAPKAGRKRSWRQRSAGGAAC
jgi:hypothetical protein